MKGDKMAKRSSFGSMVRRRLSDITNSSPQPKSPPFPQQLENASPREYIDHLVKEKMVLVKLIQEKNKIIEYSGIEIRNLRAGLQKMQLQNWTLAQTNSLLLAEVNSGRQRLKALQHEVVCKDTLLKTKNSQSKVKEEVNVQTNNVQELEELTEGSEMDDDIRPIHLSRSASLGRLSTSQKHAEKEAAVSKRRCLRRQSSASSRSRKENLFEIEIDLNSLDEMEAEARRASMCRPLRKAVEKVQSYKEKPINIKMRRSQ